MLWMILPLMLHATDKLSCSAKELARKDCRLTSGKYNIRILPQTIAWSDGVWHTVDEMPLKGEASAWEKIQFRLMGGWPILQLWLWDKGFSQTEVQSLHWYVADAEQRKFTMLADGIVRKRRVNGDKFIYDAWEPHTLKSGKNGSLEWQLKSIRKYISKTHE